MEEKLRDAHAQILYIQRRMLEGSTELAITAVVELIDFIDDELHHLERERICGHA